MPENCVIPTPLAIRNFEIHTGNEKISAMNAKVWWIDSLRSQKAEEIGLDSLTFNKTLNDLVDDGRDVRKFFSILYTDVLIDNVQQISQANIKAVAIYYKAHDHYSFKLFVRNGDVYSELQPLSGKTFRITGSSINTIAEEIIFTGKKTYSLIYIDKLPPFDNYGIKGAELLYNRIEEYIKSH